MLRHIVMLRHLQADISPIIDELQHYCANVKGIKSCQWSANASIEPAAKHGYTHAFIIDFYTSQDRDDYINDPDHQVIGAKLLAACEHGIDDIVVFDMALST